MIPISAQIQIDDAAEVVTICGIRYSAELFRSFGFDLREGQAFRLLKREDGVVTIQTDPEEAVRLAEQQRCLRIVDRYSTWESNPCDAIELAIKEGGP